MSCHITCGDHTRYEFPWLAHPLAVHSLESPPDFHSSLGGNRSFIFGTIQSGVVDCTAQMIMDEVADLEIARKSYGVVNIFRTFFSSFIATSALWIAGDGGHYCYIQIAIATSDVEQGGHSGYLGIAAAICKTE